MTYPTDSTQRGQGFGFITSVLCSCFFWIGCCYFSGFVVAMLQLIYPYMVESDTSYMLIVKLCTQDTKQMQISHACVIMPIP